MVLQIYGADSFPPVDGVNLWPLLIDPPSPTNFSAAHPSLVLSKEVIIVGRCGPSLDPLRLLLRQFETYL